MDNYTYTCEICTSFIADDGIAYSEFRTAFDPNSEEFHICNNCYVAEADDYSDDSYVFASIGWGTDEDYGYYGE